MAKYKLKNILKEDTWEKEDLQNDINLLIIKQIKCMQLKLFLNLLLLKIDKNKN